MVQKQSKTARIAKNTLMLYFRQILIMLVSLYTVRVVLEILGAEDYGIYNVVGGLVVMFGFLNAAMTSTTQRFLNFAMGQNDTEQARNVYSVSFIIHVLIALSVIVLAESAGLWFFYNWLNIPAERMDAAFWVYQFSILAAVKGILTIPYRATIIAHEKMSFFAGISIFEVLLKLGVVFLLPIITFDKLTVYAVLVSAVGFLLLLLHKAYCNRTFETAHFRYCKDKKLFQQMLVFSGWSVFVGFANIGKKQGINILINIFHGVMVNAAMGIAMQVNAAVYSFVTNFQTAFKPQVVKSYAAKDHDGFMTLIFSSSKVSFYLLFLLVLPLYINAEFVLQLWLKNVPEYAVAFTRLMLLISLTDALAGPLWMSIQAAGDIKKYQIIVGCFILANLPVSLLFLLMGFNPVWVLVVKLALSVLALIWRIFFLSGKIELPAAGFFRDVILPVFIVAGISALITSLLSGFLTEWKQLITTGVVSTVSISCLVYMTGINRREKEMFNNLIKGAFKNSVKKRKKGDGEDGGVELLETQKHYKD